MERGNLTLRFLDRWIGMPIVFGLGRLHRKRPLPDRVSMIGIFLFSVIGDSLIACAMIEDLKRRYPKARIIGFVSRANRAFADIACGLDEVILVPVSNPLEAIGVIRAQPVDILIDIAQWARINAILSFFAKAKFTVGFYKAGQYRHFAYDRLATHRADQHELENLRGLARCLGIDPHGLPRLNPKIFSAPAPDLAKPYIVLHPWPSGFRCIFREWRQERWVEAAHRLIERGFHIVITGGPADREKSVALAQKIDRPQATVSAGATILFDTCVILHHAAAVVCVNTGILHMAAAIGCRIVALNGPTNPARFGPLSMTARNLGPDRAQGGGYLDLGFEYPRHPPDCMAAISVDQVMAALESLGVFDDQPALAAGGK